MYTSADMYRSVDAAAETVTSAGADLVATVHNDLAGAGGQQLSVDLQALHDYYFRVLHVLDEFDRAVHPILTASDPYETACLETSPIAGVAMAVEGTTTAALGSGDSAKWGCTLVRNALSRHLVDIAATYEAYVNVDGEKASELQAAGSSPAADVGYGRQAAPPSGTSGFAPVPSGWK